ncbi:hypothetical protein XELAEV_18021299mg [Xenopus laevis]|uniref:Uncharacterized protein n=1 Tax=Xenopus laevis TaxID=8355 RepID=A0A974HR81_XENLA|nr:hypothetical protein XELAEV_18021299mg [Xenopus laevis]
MNPNLLMGSVHLLLWHNHLVDLFGPELEFTWTTTIYKIHNKSRVEGTATVDCLTNLQIYLQQETLG